MSSSLVDEEMKRLLGDTPEKREVLNNSGNGFTGIIGPNGGIAAGPLPDGEEGIVYGDINLEESLKWKLFHDIAGNYNRFDILSLNLNRENRGPIREVGISRARGRFDSGVLERLMEKVNEIENDMLRNELLSLIEFLRNVTS